MKFYLLFILYFWVAQACAHISGFTDTSIQIAQPGVRIIYTTPADNLLELNSAQAAPGNESPKANQQNNIETYIKGVSKGWEVNSGKRNCIIKSVVTRELETIDSYQYTLDFSCPQGLSQVDVRYTLFTDQWRGHQNYTRVFMAGEQMRTRFSFDKTTLDINVDEKLNTWGKRLDASFFADDPNRKLDRENDIEQASTIDNQQNTKTSFVWADPHFIVMGATHIWEGLDHVLFILALLLVPASLRQLILWVSMFTIAHSITLVLSYLNVVNIAPEITEPLIAFTILAIGIENILIVTSESSRPVQWRPIVIFLFGLIHGIGLSYQLGEATVGSSVIGRLLYFNIGVEIGQLLIVFVVWPILWFVFKRVKHSGISIASSALVSLFGGYWLIERVMS